MNYEIINKIKTIVAEWEINTWTDNFSNECMRKIADLVAENESEESRQTIKSCKNCGYPYKLAGRCYSCNNYSQWIPIEADKET